MRIRSAPIALSALVPKVNSAHSSDSALVNIAVHCCILLDCTGACTIPYPSTKNIGSGSVQVYSAVTLLLFRGKCTRLNVYT